MSEYKKANSLERNLEKIVNATYELSVAVRKTAEATKDLANTCEIARLNHETIRRLSKNGRV